jgi:hypothetical protein
MRIAVNADLGQMDDRDIPAVAVYDVPPLFRDFKECAPLFLTWVYRRLLRNIASVKNDDRNPGEPA